MKKKYIYHFSSGSAEGSKNMEHLLGVKGANLAEMCNLKLPIPPGFTITTEIYDVFVQNGYKLSENFKQEIYEAIVRLERTCKKKFNSRENPLLLSVRSGAQSSMPGMMDTILNLGINDEVADAIACNTNNPHCAYDSYKRFLYMYGTIVLGISPEIFGSVYRLYDDHMTKDLVVVKDIITKFKEVILKHSNFEINSDVYTQLFNSITAVLKSWNNPRAVFYRKMNNINDVLGTAINVQMMVFGNSGKNSATGVIFTRSPSNGDKMPFGEFLINAQGEDIVSGTRTPLAINNLVNEDESLKSLMPEVYSQLISICDQLELYYKDMQDIEFTVENGILYILQTRTGKRTSLADIKIIHDMALEGIFTKQWALNKINTDKVLNLLHDSVDYTNISDYKIFASGLPASPGAVTGKVVFSLNDAEIFSKTHGVILVRNDTSPDDIKAMSISLAILTSRGGITSHAAVVARGLGKPCVCGVSDITIDEDKKSMYNSENYILKQGDLITLDGSTGKIFIGNVKLAVHSFSKELQNILLWSEQFSKLQVKVNAETINNIETAKTFFVNDIGLCRTEHMFFEDHKILLVQEMIVSDNDKIRINSINKLLKLQVEDFVKLFKNVEDGSITIRLLDPPLHEFLPGKIEDQKLLADYLSMPFSVLKLRLDKLFEVNPMLGHRGCRLAISYPEIYEMQVEAIISALNDVDKNYSFHTKVEIMIPFVSHYLELITVLDTIKKKIEQMEFLYSKKFNLKIGTMIELPRAALTADKIAPHVDFFSFGTNDLTQTTYGISRDDLGSFLQIYLKKEIFHEDPFVQIDFEAVGELIKIAINKGKKVNPNLVIGVCGEHAGNPESIKFFQSIGVDYISCSPYRIPLAKIVAAQFK
ncbi:pyruvate, phosphate dikinase [Rickettsia endosymbiont of Cardiosporidium cionae]|uniref:pyruvate, phosphate dikinase n=1 Tax=Rickettsia endosymbiont of Cardiosporidium cionae TaxID=2777155 RepID=UPI001893C8E5|nr:pyruvate, phosphate dikinase [Rickettsia endosymbiont of Cardiosporidium cionae]KAF8818329.1 pyruvate, phosphate dikinase [Rickettsia endosymbiont of Cardiosporidium cionae]